MDYNDLLKISSSSDIVSALNIKEVVEKEIQKIILSKVILDIDNIEVLYNYISDNLIAICKMVKLTQTNLAKEIGVTRQTLINYINGSSPMPMCKFIAIVKVIRNYYNTKEEK